VSIEPEPGRYSFGWLDRVMEKLGNAGMQVIMATPGGAKPAWVAQMYPETLRVDSHRRRQLWGGRHNHCFTSPAYRELCQTINSKLADRYKEHPTLVLWHVNNEYNGECHCDLCQQAFRAWLKLRYHDSLEALNDSWWSRFWSHTITDWSQVESPSPIGELKVHGHNLDWKRFVTHQTIDFFRTESAPLRELTPNVPLTTNFMGSFAGLDYYEFAKHVDVVSWDNYPQYHDRPTDWLNAVWVSFLHNQRRTMKGRPHLVMECAPSAVHNHPVNKLKRPGVMLVDGLQDIAFGADSVQYFQWRKSRGGNEKFHGAVISHDGRDDTRVFREISQLGAALAKLDDIVGTTTRAEVAFVYDYQNRWALEDADGPRNEGKDYQPMAREHYRTFWSAGVAVNVIDSIASFEGYRLIVAPMLYMIRPTVAERIERFVEGGGTFVTTYMSGIVDENDLCFSSGAPGPLQRVLGLRVEETDVLYDNESVPVISPRGNKSGLKGQYRGGTYCDRIHLETAKAQAAYGAEFYRGEPAVTVNFFGKGRAYYLATRCEPKFHTDFYRHLIDTLHLRRALGHDLPEGVTATIRTDGRREFVFVIGFNRKPVTINLGTGQYDDLLSGKRVRDTIRLGAYGALVLRERLSSRSDRPARSSGR
jgi:beta-galactosidase